MSENRGPRFPQIVSYDRVPKNLLINPGFEIWQRGAGPAVISPSGFSFQADEWEAVSINSSGQAMGYSVSLLTIQ